MSLNYIQDQYFIDEHDQKVNVNANYKIIIRELNKLGIYNPLFTIEEIIDLMNPLLTEKFNSITRDATYLDQIRAYNAFHNKIRVLYLSLLDVQFYLYDYNASKMPDNLRKIYTNKNIHPFYK